MAHAADPPLVIRLTGPGWKAELVVRPPDQSRAHPVRFEVQPGHFVTTNVRYTVADNRRTGWPEWHVKIYQCGHEGDAAALRLHLHRQAVALRRVNSGLPDSARIPIEPPWAIVPVYVVRGDGQEDDVEGEVRTQLGIADAVIVEQMQQAMPSWFQDADRTPRPGRYLIAVSPFVEKLPWDQDNLGDAPGIEHLPGYETLARGLDELHRLRWVHCDITPENLCRYRTEHASGFVLIDTDAASAIVPPPTNIRTTPRYEYDKIRAYRQRLGQEPVATDQRELLGHDRFGFALVVLCALAGRGWVEPILLRTDDTGLGCGRPVDDRDRVRTLLTNRWPDARWRELIEVAAEPFVDPTCPRGIEQDGPWAYPWYCRLREAVASSEPVDPQAALLIQAFRRELDRLHEERALAPRLERVHEAYSAIEQRAHAVAVRTAVRYATGCALAILGVVGLIMFGAFGLAQ